jgi:orotidine-5'-phosphate decarboxylase
MVVSPSASNRSAASTARQTAAATISHAADRLLNAIDLRGAPVCVGLDPDVNRLPQSIRPRGNDPTSIVSAIESFCLGVLDAVVEIVPCVKPQAACFERYREVGVASMYRVIAAARQRGLQVILDAKRGDMGLTADHYATAAFGPIADDGDGAKHDSPDWITVNSYLGRDGIEPFLRPDRGAFALVRTSNPGGDALQSLPLASPSGSARTVAEAVAALVADLGQSHVGASGYSNLGAVVGATKAQDAARLRELMPRQIFLVPGFGAQGGGARDVVPCFDGRGRGAIVTASRSVLYAFAPGASNWSHAVRDAARKMADEVSTAVSSR